MQTFFQKLLKWIHWKIIGDVPKEKKFVLIAAPHTSNWDLIIGLIARFAVGGNYRFVAKHQAFVFPLGIILKKLGGIPINRNSKHQFVDTAVELFNTHDEFVLGITPEGTRKQVTRWKTGFYHIALNANVPILMVGFDYSKKEIILQMFYPTGDQAKDFKAIFDFYRDIKGLYPQHLPELK